MPHAKLFVGQLPKHINEDQLRPIFEEYGEIIELAILRDKYSQAHKGLSIAMCICNYHLTFVLRVCLFNICYKRGG